MPGMAWRTSYILRSELRSSADVASSRIASLGLRRRERGREGGREGGSARLAREKKHDKPLQLGRAWPPYLLPLITPCCLPPPPPSLPPLLFPYLLYSSRPKASRCCSPNERMPLQSVVTSRPLTAEPFPMLFRRGMKQGRGEGGREGGRGERSRSTARRILTQGQGKRKERKEGGREREGEGGREGGREGTHVPKG